MTISIPQFLQTVDAFAVLDIEQAEELSQRLTAQDYKAGDSIIKKDDPGDCMFIIVTGTVRIPIFDDSGRPVFMGELGERQFFGEMALLTGEPRNADVMAVTDCTCLVVPKEALEEKLKENPNLAKFLTAILGERLMSVNGLRQVERYKLIGELGRGGTAVVYEAIHPTLGRSVAIKMLSHTLVYHREFADRFRNEAKIIAHLRHPHIIEIYDALESYATFFIVMEKLNGLDIAEILDARGPLPEEEVRDTLCQLASALDYAHKRGVVHRDVKPSNIVMNDDGTVKLTDFGIAFVPSLEEKLNAAKGIALGTPYYMSPEQARARPVDGRADIYALGIVAFEMITGEVPYHSDDRYEILEMHVYDPMPSPKRYKADIAPDLEKFIMKACQKNPDERFQTCAEILDFFGRSERQVTEDIGVKTLTVVFEPGAEGRVQEILAEATRRIANIPGVIVR